MSVSEVSNVPETAGKSRRERIVLLLALMLGVVSLTLDQWTKFVVERQFYLGESVPVWEPFFSLTFVRNEGAAWSILTGYGWLLLAIAGVVTASVIWFFRSLTEGYSERCFALILVLSGVVGNSIDRVWRGAVVDFFDFHWYSQYRFPVFNVADIAICVGVGLFVLSTLLRPSKKKEDVALEEKTEPPIA